MRVAKAAPLYIFDFTDPCSGTKSACWRLVLLTSCANVMTLVPALAVLAGAWVGATLIPVVLASCVVASRLLGRLEHGHSAMRCGSLCESVICWAYAVLHLAGLVVGAMVASRGDLADVQNLVLLLAAAVTCGIYGFTVAHALIHRRHWIDRMLGALILVSVGYLHFYVHHQKIHHARVGTLADPGTPRLGQSLYAFWLQSVVGNWKLSWELGRQGCAGTAVCGCLTNIAVWSVLSFVLLVMAVLVGLGPRAAMFVIFTAFIAITALEGANYIQHYGLTRARRGDRYEPVSSWIAWNAPGRWTNVFILDLGHHSEHHLHARAGHLRPEEIPVLPLGFSTMFLVAFVPPLWRRLMDRRVEEVRERRRRCEKREEP